MILSTLIFAAAATLAQPQDFEKFFDDFAKKREGIQVLQAEYTEKSITPDETFLSEGSLLYAQPRRIVRHTFYPYDSTVVIDQQTSIEYEPEVKQAVVSDLSQVREADILFFGFESDTKRLRENYEVKLFTIQDNPLGKNGLEIKPKEKDGQKPFESVTLYLADDSLLPYRIHVIFDAESELQVDIGQYTINGDVAPEQTQVTLAEGTKLIQNDKVIETIGAGGKKMPEPAALPVVKERPQAAGAQPAPPEQPALVEITPLN